MRDWIHESVGNAPRRRRIGTNRSRLRPSDKAITSLILQSFDNLETNFISGIGSFLALRAYLNDREAAPA